MAHAAQLGALTEELVELVTSTSSKPLPKTERSPSLQPLPRSLHPHPAVPQLSPHEPVRRREPPRRPRGALQRPPRDGLARALRQSLDAFAPLRTKWAPDILHFLLEIADQPAQKTDLQDLALLHRPKEGAGPPLTWEDIAREDGWHREPDLWRSVDFRDSSDDEDYQDDTSGAGHDSDDTSVAASDALAVRRPEDFQVETRHDAALQAVQQSQSWRLPDGHQQPSAGPSRKMAVSEFHMIREALFMLQGLETSLFQKHGQPDPAYQVASMAWETCKALVGWFAEAGRRLAVLRSFASRRQTMPLLQVFHANVMTSLQSFDKELSRIQHRLIAPPRDTVVSSIALQRELGPHLEPLNALSDIVRQLEEGPQAGAFRYLELLYQHVGAAQARWQEWHVRVSGPHVLRVLPDVPLNQIWQEQFKLRRTSDGKLHVPNFLEPSAAKIFTAGKSIVVLKHLGKYESTRAQWNRPEPLLTFDAVCPEGSDFAPFNELFGSAFGSWIQSKHHATSEALKQVLFASCDLWSNIDALESLYFMSDGFVADAFARKPVCQDRCRQARLARPLPADRARAGGFLLTHLSAQSGHRAAQEAEERHELSRLSVMSSPPPYQQRGGTPKRARPARWGRDSDDDAVDQELDTNEDTGERQDRHQRHRRGRGPAAESSGHQDETYTAILAGISGDLERHMRFICGGLRGVARASSDEAAAKWDMLAEMLESGVGGEL
ncbi:conserved hypothetical protein [Verticillium alfalfae VaMs.102]|uniref:Spindle pole body component n=1 Tax=Verticillium alfalfae (strain VaMs.102 / ATCC MYA-4576 / FGSC 10136) TaxID=526221 RepID=C9S8U8_VERA1|nr:conserved hypothetical protein [Verticillium alfalfae VaMs.102]EEY14025.1 conserved hypothetical protein [Verticillium alfalfae VaMs.102]